MAEYRLKAYHDPKCEPVVAEMILGYSASLPEFMPKLAEGAGLGIYVKNEGGGTHTYENGVMTVEKVYDKPVFDSKGNFL